MKVFDPRTYKFCFSCLESRRIAWYFCLGVACLKYTAHEDGPWASGITEVGLDVWNTGTRKCVMEPEVAGEERGRLQGLWAF